MEEFIFGLSVAKVHRLIEREAENSVLSLGIKDLSVSQMRIIMFLSKSDNVCQKQIEEQFDLKCSSVSLSISDMEKNGYVDRVQSKSDARLKNIVLTKKSKDVFKKVLKVLEDTHSLCVKGINKEEMDVCLSVIKKVKDNITSKEIL